MKRSWLLLLMLAGLTVHAQPLPTGKVELIVVPKFEDQKLNLGTYYKNANGDSLSVNLFRFYISHINIGGNVDDSTTGYHLVDAAEPNTQRFYLHNLPVGTYNSLQFVVGVDSLANVSGALEGDLDPSRGMYWAWNTGYIMAKLEGRSPVCKTLHHEYQYHIGGYLPPYNAARTVVVPAKQPIVIKENKTTTIVLYADVSAWFTGIDIKQMNDVVTPGKQSMAIADNYKQMFTIGYFIND